jgi:uncharacterized protein
MLTSLRLSSPVMRHCLVALVALLWSGPGLLAAGATPLADSPSLFLRQQADSPVRWMAWGEEAFSRARSEGRPVFLAVGAAYSELSAAMNRQTFQNADIAAFLNQNFVCVLVDRDEHPAVAAQGQAYVRAVKQLSGWPLNLWLTPELQPFDGATYLPPSEEWGKEGFLNAAQRVAAAWRQDPARARASATEALQLIREFEYPARAERFRPGEVRTSLQGSAAAWAEQSDAERGGFGETPRHPEPEMLRFLLRADARARDAAVANLHALLRSALRDPIDGGFFRYTADAQARIPYFQKRLSDQARLTLALLDAKQLAPNPAFDAAARGALDYVLTRLARGDGGFIAGEDATGTGARAFHVWTYRDLTQALGAEAGAAFARAHRAERDGNVSRDDDPSHTLLGQNILAGAPDPAHAPAIARLRAIRDRRPAPARDESVVAVDQGLILLALARAGRELEEPRYTAAAQAAAAFIQRTFGRDDGTLTRLAGSTAAAGPEDFAAIALGLRLLNTEESRTQAERLLRRADELFLDAATGTLFTTPATLPPGIWLRLPTPASGPGEFPAPAPLRLIAGDPFPETLAALIATQHRDASLPASGDVLLALRLYVDRLP